MAGLAPKLPLTYNSRDGFTLLKNFQELAKQNFKMLILTIPGERVMEPNFGVGITQFLFSNFHANTYMEIDSKIRSQTKAYMPFVEIIDISFDSGGQDMNLLAVSIKYSIPRIGVADLLEFTI
tara:strand:+ start:10875 stop:11243 length:369 start_codon:yes stop_codon:yes gene_type:complete